jgi:hypothetical protein
MMHYHDLRGRRLRRHRRFLTQVKRRGVVYIRTEPEFRMASRLHHIGMVTACVSKWNWIGPFNGRPFRELAVYTSEAEALKYYYRTLPRSRSTCT